LGFAGLILSLLAIADYYLVFEIGFGFGSAAEGWRIVALVQNGEEYYAVDLQTAVLLVQPV